MDILDNYLLVRFDGRRQKLIIDYVYRGQIVPGKSVLLTYIRVQELQAVPPSRAAHRIGQTMLLALPGAYRAVYGSKTVRGAKASRSKPNRQSARR